jgi:mycoredoxin
VAETIPIIMYGATDCEDTARSRDYLTARGLPFREVNIDHDPDGERFVIVANNGARWTPTLIIGRGRDRRLLTEPTDEELEAVLDTL